MCGSKGTSLGGQGTTQTGGVGTTVTSGTGSVTPVNPQTAQFYSDILSNASGLGQTPFNPSTLGQVAQWMPGQETAAENLYQLGLNAGRFDPSQIQQIMSPYIQDVVNATQNQFNNQNAIQGNQLIGQAIRSGNIFGGDRAGVAAAQLAGQQQTAQAPVIAGLYQSGYGQALNEANFLRQAGLSGGQQAIAASNLYPAYVQRALDVQQQNAIQQQAYPFQLANWLTSEGAAIGPLTGTQTAQAGTTGTSQLGLSTPPPPNPVTQGLGFASLGLSALPFLLPAKRGGLVPHRQEGGGLGTPFDTIPLPGGGSAAPRSWMGMPRVGQSVLQPMQLNLPQIGNLLPQQGKSGTGTGTTDTSGGVLGAGDKFLKTLTGGTGPGGQGPSPLENIQNWFAPGESIGESSRSFGDTSPFAPSVGEFSKRGGLIHHAGGGLAGYKDGDEVDDDPEEGAPYQLAGEPVAAGRTTWFNPRPYGYRDPSGNFWYDESAARLREGEHASGLPITTPGLALSSRENLGRPVVATLPDGRRVLTTQTDVSPPGVVDLNAALAARLGYTPGTVPTGTTRVETADRGDVNRAWLQGEDVGQPGPGGGGGLGVGQPRVAFPGFAQRPRTRLEEWAASPLTRFAMGALGSRSPYFGQGLAAGLQGAAGAINERYQAESEKDKPSKLLTSGDTMMYQFGDGRIIDLGLPGEAATRKQIAGMRQQPKYSPEQEERRWADMYRKRENEAQRALTRAKKAAKDKGEEIDEDQFLREWYTKNQVPGLPVIPESLQPGAEMPLPPPRGGRPPIPPGHPEAEPPAGEKGMVGRAWDWLTAGKPREETKPAEQPPREQEGPRDERTPQERGMAAREAMQAGRLTLADFLNQARTALARGVPRGKIDELLRAAGIDPRELDVKVPQSS